MNNTFEFSRGDATTHTFSIPADAWSPGGTLFFAAKPSIDDDSTDAAAVIKQSWTDGSVTDTTINGVAYKKYSCYFPSSATASIPSNGAQQGTYLGEFEWVDASGKPTTFPAKDPKLTVIVYFDVVVEI